MKSSNSSMEDPNADTENAVGSGVESEAEAVESSLGTVDLKDEKVDKEDGIEEDDEEFDLVSHSDYFLDYEPS
jgi:hypothetical protein